MSRWYMTDEERRGYEAYKQPGHDRYEGGYDYEKGWDTHAQEERREQERRDEERQQLEAEERRQERMAHERSMMQREEEYLEQQYPPEPQQPEQDGAVSDAPKPR